MKSLKRFVMTIVVVLACAGVYGALRNLPVASGCGFYGDCPEPVETKHAPATSLAANPVSASAGQEAP